MMTKSKLATVAALALLAGGVQAAAPTGAAESLGNSALMFVAIDSNSNTGLVIDLGLSMSDFSNATAGNLLQGSWNFATNTANVGNNNGAVSITGNSWSAAYDTFKSTQAGGDLLWGVIAADAVTGATSATNTIAGRGVLATGNATAAQMLSASTTAPTGTAIGNFNNWLSATRNLGTLTTANNGSAATTSADTNAWLNVSTMGGNFGGALTWNYLLGNGLSSTIQWQQQGIVAPTGNPVVYQFGNPTTMDSLTSGAQTFTFDVATNTLVLAVPEPGTYAMLLAGIAALGFVARRRQA